MEPKRIKFIDTRIWLIAIPLVNLVPCVIYFIAFPDESFWKNLWNYLSSDVFLLITGSLIIPLLFSLLEKRYKFMENIQKQREERKKRIEEQRRSGRQETINDTIAMWHELYGMTSEVIYFTPGKNEKKEIKLLITKLINFTSSAEHIVNKWTHQFPNLTYDDHDVFLEFINILYQSGLSIAYFIQEGMDKKEIEKLQDMLFVIQDQVKNIANHRMINALKYSARMLEKEEGGASLEDIEQSKSKIDFEIGRLRDWYNALNNLDAEYDNFLAPARGEGFDEIRKTAREIETWLKEDRNRSVGQAEKFNDFREQFYKINLEERLRTVGIPYTVEYISGLAEWLSFESACSYIYSRAHNIW